MLKTILVAAGGSERDAATFAAALAVARPFAAHLDVLHVRMDPVSIAVAMATDGGGGALATGLIERLEQEASERAAKAHDIFTRFCGEAGLALASAPSREGEAAPSAEWHVETGEEPRWMAAYGIAADLVVAPRATAEDGLARSTLEAVLIETGRPLLIPAASAMPASFERIAIAWKPTAQAARAVALAMPFLARAKEIAVITVEEASEGPGGDSDAAGRLVRSLAWHGPAVKAERLTPGPESAAATLLAHVSGHADLLIMGGYGHNRLREWVFGGFTQEVLVDAPLPVLIAH